MSLKLEYNFQNWINTKVDWNFFEYSFWNKEETLDKLELLQLSEKNKSKVIWINATKHSNKVITVDAKNIKNKTRLLKEWIDWVIVTNIEETKDKISLILWVADCAAISIVSQSWNTMWLIHAWHKWTSNDIIWNLINQIGNIEDWKLEEYEIYIAPMAWDNFEFDENLYFQNFQTLCDNYKLHSWKYFIPTSNWKWNLDLKSLINDLLIKNWISSKNIYFEPIDTNSTDNNWPSYRQTWTTKRILVSLNKE